MFRIRKLADCNGEIIGVLALVLLLASSLSLSGVVIIPVDGKPAISLDICHVSGGFDRSQAVVLLAPGPQPATIGLFEPARFVPEPVGLLILSLNEAPDPPPPKQPV